MDFGVYCIQFILEAFHEKEPIDVNVVPIDINQNGVEIGICAILKFPENGLATFNTDLRVELPNRATISGTKGIITVSR